jgi:subtilisin family serine protease
MLRAPAADGPQDITILGWEVEGMPKSGKPGGGGGTQPAQTVPYGIVNIKADQAWATTTGSAVNVLVADTGIQKDHPDLQANIKGGKNYACNSPTRCDASKWNDGNGHGTHVSGTIGAINNAIGVVGAAPTVNLYAAKVLTDSGSGSWYWLEAAINDATATRSDSDQANDIHIITMSLGGSSAPASLATAVANAYASGIVLVAAMGNSGDGNPSTTETSYPAAYPEVIGVGAVDVNNIVASWSSSAAYAEICAPGVSVYSTYKGSSYATLSGTSMATPHATGSIALMLSAFPGTSPEGVRSKLASTAVDIGASANSCGSGLVDALALSN